MKNLLTTRFFVMFCALLFAGIFCSDSSKKETKIQKSTSETSVPIGCENDGNCFICNPELREKGRLWCREHYRYEDRCFLCHPELEEKGRLWCKEHSLYEDECHLCHPEIKKETSDAKTPDTSNSEWNLNPNNSNEKSLTNVLMCREHRVPEEECAYCHPEVMETARVGANFKMYLLSKFSAQKAGIKTRKSYHGIIQNDNTFFGKVIYNKNRLININSLYSGKISNLYVSAGQRVLKNQRLLDIHSVKISQLKSNYLSALNDKSIKKEIYEREQGLFDKNINSRESVNNALALFNASKNLYVSLKQELINAGFSNKSIIELENSKTSSPELTLYAPFTGTITEQFVTIGNIINEETNLLQLVDLNKVWVDISIPTDYLHELNAINAGDSVVIKFSNIQEEDFSGTLLWISSSIDEQSKMLKACAVIDNDSRLLKNGMYGTVQIASMFDKKKVIIHKDAVQKIDGNEFVFIKQNDELFNIRKVITGESDMRYVAVLKGLAVNENVVHVGSFTLKSELLKERFGAGCICGAGGI